MVYYWWWWWMWMCCCLVVMTLGGGLEGGSGTGVHDHEAAAASVGGHSRRRNSSSTISDEVVTYNGRSLIINGQPKILFSGSIHYPRSTPQMWPDLIAKAKEGGIDVIQTYVFWNQHEPQPDQYDFGGRNDIVRFIKEIKAQGLYACLRIGPFIESEWTYGGLPFWLHDVPGIVYRSDNEPFKHYMQKFTTKIVNLMKSEGLYASQGGPIILSQIENEYRNVEAAFHEKGPPYVQWAAKMAVGLQTGVPWVMCKQDDAPDPVINACNGMSCGETFAGPNSPNKPAIWTENWTSFYQVFGGEPYIRSAEDIAFAVALFLAKNGSYVNYYMYHGGTNFGRTGAEYMTTSYYDQAPLDEYGLIRQPKWGHLKELHSVIKLYSETLLSGTYTNFSLGPLQDAYVFEKSSGECVAFLSNRNKTHTATVQYRNSSYELPHRSISILSDCKNVVFNTAKVSTQYNTRSVGSRKIITSPEKWQGFKDTTPTYEETSLRANMLLEHMNTTKDASDHLWYTFSFEYKHTGGGHPVLHVNSLGHVLHAFVNEQYVGYAHGSHDYKGSILEYPVSLTDGMNHISLLSVMVGLPDSGAYLERRVTGLRKVYIQDNNGSKVFTNYAWGYQVGLTGEHLRIYADEGTSKVQWSGIANSTHQPLTWYKTTFDAPMGNDPVVLDLSTMGKGEAWVNGQSIGRYWVSLKSSKGNPSQTLYHVPREFLKPTGNLLVILEEINGDPLQISLGTISISKVCGHVSYDNLHSVNSWQEIDNTDVGRNKKHNGGRPKVQLECPQGKKISHILFASLGTPLGDCNKYATGSCNSSNSKKVIQKACLGRRRCVIPEMINSFGADPCPGISKSLLVDAECS